MECLCTTLTVSIEIVPFSSPLDNNHNIESYFRLNVKKKPVS